MFEKILRYFEFLFILTKSMFGIFDVSMFYRGIRFFKNIKSLTLV